MESPNIVISIVIVVILFGLGIGLLYSTIKDRLKANAALKWPVVKGVVTQSQILEDYVRTATGTVNPSYTPAVTYEFRANGQKYTAQRVIFGRPKFSFIVAGDILERFPEGAQVDVHYNPADPADAVLLPKARQGMRSLIPGVFILVSAILVVIVMIIYQ